MMPSKVLRCTEAYLDESYDGNLFDLLCSSIGYYGIEFRAHIDNKALGRTNFFKRTSTCNRQCQRCAYCAELADELSGLWLDHSRDARGYGADVDDRRHRSAIRRQLPCLPLLFKDAP